MELFKEWLFSGFDTPKDIAAQIFGIIPVIIALFIYAQRTRTKIVILKGCMDVSQAIHLVILGDFTTALLSLVATIRNLIFLKNENMGKWRNLILAGFMAFTIICAIPDFSWPMSLIPVTGSIFALVGFWQEDIKKLRIYNLIAVLLWFIYGIYIVSISSILIGIMSLISIFAGFIRSAKVEKQ